MSFATFQNTAVIHNFSKFKQVCPHGTGLEYAAHVNDLFHFKHAKWIGADNVFGGADRISNNVPIQSKCYQATPQGFNNLKQSLFENGEFKYKGQNVEVTADLYDKYKDKLDQLANEHDFEFIRSPYTKEQCTRISKAFNVDSIMCDAKLGLVTAAKTVPLSFTITFAVSYFNDRDITNALKTACKVSVKSFGVTFATTLITAQISKTMLVQNMQVGNIVANKATQKIVGRAYKNTGLDITKMKNPTQHTKNIIKSNIVANGVTTLVLSTPDIARCISGRISKAQLLKNTGVTFAGIVGGSTGYVLGAACGSFIPVVGTFVGGMIGSTILGGAASKFASLTLDAFIENDGDKMLDIFNSVFQKHAEICFLCESEIDYVVLRLKEEGVFTDAGLRDIYASDDREAFCDNILSPFIDEVCAIRPFVVVPDLDEIEVSEEDINEILEEDDISEESDS